MLATRAASEHARMLSCARCRAPGGSLSHQRLRHAPGPEPADPAAAQGEPEPEAEGTSANRLSSSPHLTVFSRLLTARAPRCTQVYFMEEKFRGQVMRLGAPGGFESVLQESLEAQVSLKAAQEELVVRDELLGACILRPRARRRLLTDSRCFVRQRGRVTRLTRSSGTSAPRRRPPPPPAPRARTRRRAPP